MAKTKKNKTKTKTTSNGNANVLQQTEAGRQLQERLTSEHTILALTRLLDRIDGLEQTVQTLVTTIEQAPGMISMVADTADEAYRQATASGVDIEARLKAGASLADQLLSRSDQLEQLMEMADQAPGMISMVADIADESYRQAAQSGVDIEARLKAGASLADKLLSRSDQLEQLMEMADQAPGMISMVADIADESYRQAAQSGVDIEARLKAGASLADKLLSRSDQLEQLMEMADQAPGMISMVADIADESYRQAAQSGVDIEARLKAGASLADKLLSRSDQLEQLMEMADQAPGMISMVADIADETYRQAAQSGVDIEARLKAGASLADKLLSRSDQLEQLMEMADQAPGMVSMVADIADETYRQAAQRGVDIEERLLIGMDITEKLTSPQSMAVLSKLLDRMDQLDQLVDMADQAPGMISMVADTADEAYRQAAQAGIDIEARLSGSLLMIEKLTAPETMEVLSALLSRTDKLGQAVELIDQGPGLAAMAMDTLDEAYHQALMAGIDIDSLVSQGLSLSTILANFVSSKEFQSLQHSGVLDPKVLNVVGSAGKALVTTQEQTLKPAGLFDLVGAIRDPNMQRALSFLLAFGKNFGQSL